MFKRVTVVIPCLGGGREHLRTTGVEHSRDVRQNTRDAAPTNSHSRLCSHRPHADYKHIYHFQQPNCLLFVVAMVAIHVQVNVKPPLF